MKKLFILILAGMMAVPSFAQFGTSRSRSRFNHSDTEIYYGLRLGLNIASLSSDDAEIDMDSRTGLAFGGVCGFQLANSTPVWLETGVFYSEKGGENNYNDGKVTCRLSYLQVPMVLKYAFDVYDDFYIQPYLGGYLALGVTGKVKKYATKESYSSFHDMNRLDGGLRIGCGFEYQMLYAELGLDLGLANIGKDDFDSVRTRSLFINIGVNF